MRTAASVTLAALALAGRATAAEPPSPPAQQQPLPAPPQPRTPSAEAARPAARVLTLDEAIATALAHQPQLRQARASTEAARARADIARAPLLPQVTLSGQYRRTTANVVGNPGITGLNTTTRDPSFDTYNFFQFGVTVSQYIWDFGQTTGRWRAAQASARVQAEAERTTRQQVILGARTAYFAVRATRDLTAVARDTLANQERHLGQIQGQVAVGTRPDIDLAQARSDRATAEAQLITAENNYATAKAQLALALGLADAGDYEVEAYHEKLKTQTQKVTVKAGEPAKVDFAFKG